MKTLILMSAIVLTSSCALLQQVKDPEGYRTSHTPVDPYEKAKATPGNIYVANEMSKPEAYAEYKKLLCEGFLEKECLAKYNDTFFARLKEVYPYADMGSLGQHCNAHPVECKNMVYVENVTIQLFNSGIDEIKRRDIAVAQESERQERARFFQGMAAGMQQYQQQQYQQQYQQQLIQQSNKPVNTNCRMSGNRMDCTTSR